MLLFVNLHLMHFNNPNLETTAQTPPHTMPSTLLDNTCSHALAIERYRTITCVTGYTNF